MDKSKIFNHWTIPVFSSVYCLNEIIVTPADDIPTTGSNAGQLVHEEYRKRWGKEALTVLIFPTNHNAEIPLDEMIVAIHL